MSVYERSTMTLVAPQSSTRLISSTSSSNAIADDGYFSPTSKSVFAGLLGQAQ